MKMRFLIPLMALMLAVGSAHGLDNSPRSLYAGETQLKALGNGDGDYERCMAISGRAWPKECEGMQSGESIDIYDLPKK